MELLIFRSHQINVRCRISLRLVIDSPDPSTTWELNLQVMDIVIQMSSIEHSMHPHKPLILKQVLHHPSLAH
jgi:hypothetical protein